MHYWLSKIVFAAIASVAILNVNSTFADDRFSVAIGSKDQLVIFGSNGEKAAELNPPAIAQAVKVGNSSFQVSYGRDVNDRWTVIIAPSTTSPTPLSFTTLDNKIDSDKSGVVTLTYGKDLKTVTVDPGYVGVVKLNDARITSAIAATNAPAPKPAPVVAVEPRKEEPAPAPVVASTPEPAPAAPAPAPATETPKVDTAAPATAAVESTPPAIEAPKVVPQLDPEHAYWAEPITPPDPKDLPQIASDEIKLVEIKGTVTVTLPNTTQEVAATEGMTIPSGTKVKTGPDGSAAAFLGGVNSARLMPATEGTVNQKVANNTRETLIDLKEGVVFSNVGRRAGETQDFKVKTPAGVAAAKGTAFLTLGAGGQLFVAAQQGSVGVTGSNGNSLGTATGGPGGPGVVNSDPGANQQTNNAILASQLIVANAFNNKINALLAKEKTGTLTPAERSYLANAPRIAAQIAGIMNAAVQTQGFQGRIPPIVEKLIGEKLVPTTTSSGEGAGNGGGTGTGAGAPGGDTGGGVPQSQNVNTNSPLNTNPSSLNDRTSPT